MRLICGGTSLCTRFFVLVAVSEIADIKGSFFVFLRAFCLTVNMLFSWSRTRSRFCMLTKICDLGGEKKKQKKTVTIPYISMISMLVLC